jgi:hypothetical protein
MPLQCIIVLIRVVEEGGKLKVVFFRRRVRKWMLRETRALEAENSFEIVQHETLLHCIY